MRTPQRIMEGKVRQTMLVNGVALPFSGALKSLRRFCQPAMFRMSDPVIDAAVIGSAVFIRYRASNWGLCTSHQFVASPSEVDANGFFLGLEDVGAVKIGVPPVEAIRVKFDEAAHANLGDIFIARFDDEQDGRELRPHFLQVELEASLRTLSTERIIAVLAIGFPTQAANNEVLFDDTGAIVGASSILRYVTLYFKKAEPVALDHPNRLPLVLDPRNEETLADANGMSGAPAFVLYLDDAAQARLEFAGIITNSNDYRYMLYEADKIKLLLDRALEQPSV